MTLNAAFTNLKSTVTLVNEWFFFF